MIINSIGINLKYGKYIPIGPANALVIIKKTKVNHAKEDKFNLNRVIIIIN